MMGSILINPNRYKLKAYIIGTSNSWLTLICVNFISRFTVMILYWSISTFAYFALISAVADIH